jgi:hypothetical protein
MLIRCETTITVDPTDDYFSSYQKVSPRVKIADFRTIDSAQRVDISLCQFPEGASLNEVFTAFESHNLARPHAVDLYSLWRNRLSNLLLDGFLTGQKFIIAPTDFWKSNLNGRQHIPVISGDELHLEFVFDPAVSNLDVKWKPECLFLAVRYRCDA